MKLTNIIKEEYQDINETIFEKEKNTEKTNQMRDALLLVWNSRKKNGIETSRYKPITNEKSYETSYKIVEQMSYDRSALSAFCFAIDPSNEKKSNISFSIFTSALMNAQYKKEKRNNSALVNNSYIITVKHFQNTIDYFGFLLDGPRVEILGDLGDWTGSSMRKGKITIYGNSHDCCGFSMIGGTIFVKENTGKFTGLSMKGGKIEIVGNSKDYTGNAMDGGVIRVSGTIAGIGNNYFTNQNIKRGKIYEKEQSVFSR